MLSAIFLMITSTQIGKIISYSILGLSCFVAYYFTLYYVPETKDKTLDECVRLVQDTRLHRVSSKSETSIQLSEKINTF